MNAMRSPFLKDLEVGQVQDSPGARGRPVRRCLCGAGIDLQAAAGEVVSLEHQVRGSLHEEVRPCGVWHRGPGED